MMSIIAKRLAAGLAVLALLLAAVWMGHSRIGRSDSPSATSLVRDLRAKMPWLYRWVDARLGTPTRPGLPRLLVGRVIYSDIVISQRRQKAAGQLASMGTNAWPVVPELVEALNDSDSSVSMAASSVLGKIRAIEHPEWSRLEKGLSGRSRPVRVLRYLLSGGNESLQPHDLAHRRFGLICLAAVGPEAGQATPDVIKVLTSKEDYELWPAAIVTFRKIGGDVKEVVPYQKTVLLDGEATPNTRASALRVLALAAPEAPETRDLLRQTLLDEKAMVRLTAASELWRLHAPPGDVLPTFAALLRHKLVTIRTNALNALSEMGIAALPIRSEVARLTSDDNSLVRQAAEAALKRIPSAPNTNLEPTNPTDQPAGASRLAEPEPRPSSAAGSRR